MFPVVGSVERLHSDLDALIPVDATIEVLQAKVGHPGEGARAVTHEHVRGAELSVDDGRVLRV